MTGNTRQGSNFVVNRGLLRGGFAMLCVGGLMWLAGAAMSGGALVGAGRRYVQQMDERPTQIVRRQWAQLKAATAARSEPWNDVMAR